MTRLLLALACAALTLRGQGQPVRDRTLGPILAFETQRTPGPLADWGGGPAGTLFADNQVVPSGLWSARIERTATSANQFSTMTRAMPVDFTGAKIELRGFLRTEDVSGYAGMWLREDGDTGTPVAFDNMQDRGPKGATEWTEYSILLPLRPTATRLVYGLLS